MTIELMIRVAIFLAIVGPIVFLVVRGARRAAMTPSDRDVNLNTDVARGGPQPH